MKSEDDKLEISCSNCTRSIPNQGTAVHSHLRPGDSARQRPVFVEDDAVRTGASSRSACGIY